jgi:hypothetical protein
VAQDVDEIYSLAAEAIKEAGSPEERRKAFRRFLLHAFEAGVDAMREIQQSYSHDRPTPIPPPPGPGDLDVPDEDDPGTLPQDKPHMVPTSTWRKPKPE